MEHGHDMQDAVSLAGAESNGHGIGVEENGPVRIHNALGVACRGRRIADHGRIAFGKIRREIIFLGKLSDEVVVHDEIGDVRCWLLASVREHHDMLDGLQLVFDEIHKQEKVLIHEEDLVLGMVDDVDEMILRQPEVSRVQNRPVARHAEVELQVSVVVEGQHWPPCRRA